MADKKISQLTTATTPLAGTEVLPIVQSGVTKQVSVQNVLTSTQPSGTANGVLYLDGNKVAASGSQLVFDGTRLGIGKTPIHKLDVQYDSNWGPIVVRSATLFVGLSSDSTANGNDIIYNSGSALRFSTMSSSTGAGYTERGQFDASGNFKVTNGNLVIGTSGKGIDFSADGQAAGMTSELLDDYEEGTWTPVLNGFTITGSPTTSGTYTKIGRIVYITGRITATTIDSTVGVSYVTGLPFSQASITSGLWQYAGSETEIFSVILVSSNIAFAPTFAGYPSIDFSATYIV